MRIDRVITPDTLACMTTGEFNFQPLEEIGKSRRVWVATFNVSLRDNKLLRLLGNRPSNWDTRLITNIPQSQNYDRGIALKNIKDYTTLLNGFPTVIRYFNSSLHGKLIVTDSSVYIGSANYSEASCGNTEFGVVIRNAGAVEAVSQAFWTSLERDSIRYIGDRVQLALLDLQSLSGSFTRCVDALDSQAFVYPDADPRQQVYNTISNTLTCRTVDSIVACLQALEQTVPVQDGIREIKDVTAQYPVDLGLVQKALYLLLEEDSIRTLSDYDPEKAVMDAIGEAPWLADEEEREDHAETAYAEARCRKSALAEAAEKDLTEVYSLLRSLDSQASQRAECLQRVARDQARMNDVAR